MIKSISPALAALAVVTFACLTGQASAQSCSSCGTAPSFGFPTAPSVAGCGNGGCQSGGHGHFDEFKQKIAHASSVHERAAARNDAWPKPFSCWDKTGYYDIWRPMIQAGTEVNSVLDGNYFTDDNELNRVGIDRVAGVLLNMPSNERTVYVTRGANEGINQARVNSIRHTIATYYSHVGGVNVQLSDRIPRTIAGTTILNNRILRNSSLPPAIIPVGSGGSVNTSVTQ